VKTRLVIILMISIIITSCCNLVKYSIHNSDYNLKILESEPNQDYAYNAYVFRPDTEDPIYKIVNIAESLYLPKDIVLGPLEYLSPNEKNNRENILNVENLWWRRSCGDINIPYSITKSAINYYVDLINTFRKNERENNGKNAWKSATFEYIIDVRRPIIFEKNGYVFKDKNRLNIVTLKLKWESYAANLNALEFKKERIVVFNDAGKVLAVFGDGPTIFFVA
jgi:hypothetical protein